MFLLGQALLDSTLKSTDQERFQIEDLFFSLEECVIKYIVVRKSAWFPGSLVLVPTSRVVLPLEFGSVDIPIDMSASAVKRCRTISAVNQITSPAAANQVPFLQMPLRWGTYAAPGLFADPAFLLRRIRDSKRRRKNSIRVGSLNDFRKFEVVVSNSEEHMASIRDIIANVMDWSIESIVIDTGGWLGRDLQRVAFSSIDSLDANARCVQMDVKYPLEQVGQDFEANAPVNEVEETIKYDYYGRRCDAPPAIFPGPLL